ncbi:MAG: ABC transporter ATP-binding protein [Anaerolineae bacterium]|nr:ABC transporter ATP-binding protein [Anaerolineae bacterium]
MLLEVSRVDKHFKGLQALNHISLTVEPNEIVGLIGPNGSGKSTLFNVITGTLPVSAGTIRFQGEDITRFLAHRVAKRGIARTFQHVRPFLHMTVLENVMVGCLYGHSSIFTKTAARKKACEVLELVNLKDQAQLPASQLNVMARKWLEVGRALATDPKLLLLDEFMAGLNPAEVQAGIEFVKQLKSLGYTLIIVEHIMKAIMNCSDRIVVLNAGEKIAEGSPAEIVKNPDVIKAYLGSSYAEA